MSDLKFGDIIKNTDNLIGMFIAPDTTPRAEHAHLAFILKDEYVHPDGKPTKDNWTHEVRSVGQWKLDDS